MDQKLFAVYLGGRAPKCNTELHDVVFVVGSTIEDTYISLMDKWFGTPEGLHLDSWMEIDIVDGYRVKLSSKRSEQGPKLFFINLGAYAEGQFTEVHANKFLVARTKVEAKARGKKELLAGWGSPVHTDDLCEVDDCLELTSTDGVYVTLEPTTDVSVSVPCNGYHLIPKALVEGYQARKNG